MLQKSRLRCCILIALMVIMTLFSTTYMGERNLKSERAAAKRKWMELISDLDPVAENEMEEDMVTVPADGETTDAKFNPQASIVQYQLSNVNMVIDGPYMFNTGNLNITNSTIRFTDRVQFFSTKQTVILDALSTWTFTHVVEVMVFTTWDGDGLFYFTEGSNLTVTSSNILTCEAPTIYKGTITIGNLRTKILMNAPSINTGRIVLVDRTSEYVCAVPLSRGLCQLRNVTVNSLAVDLTGWRIAQQLEVRGGLMVVKDCNIDSQTTLPFELQHRSAPKFQLLEVKNLTRAAIFCNTRLGSTAFSDTTAFIVDTSCTYDGNRMYSSVAYPFNPSDGWMIDWGTMVFANVSRTSKGFYIDSGVFHVDGQSMYIDVIDVGDPYTVTLLWYNATVCMTTEDWEPFIRIEGCPDTVDCQHSGQDLGGGRCALLFHLNDYNPSNESLWWLLLLIIIPVCCCCCFCCWYCRRRRRDKKARMRDESPDAELAFGKDTALPLPASARQDRNRRASRSDEALNSYRPSHLDDTLHPTQSAIGLPAPSATPRHGAPADQEDENKNEEDKNEKKEEKEEEEEDEENDADEKDVETVKDSPRDQPLATVVKI